MTLTITQKVKLISDSIYLNIVNKTRGQCNKLDFDQSSDNSRISSRDKNFRGYDNEFVWMEQRDIRASIRSTKDEEDRGEYHVFYVLRIFERLEQITTHGYSRNDERLTRSGDLLN